MPMGVRWERLLGAGAPPRQHRSSQHLQAQARCDPVHSDTRFAAVNEVMSDAPSHHGRQVHGGDQHMYTNNAKEYAINRHLHAPWAAGPRAWWQSRPGTRWSACLKSPGAVKEELKVSGGMISNCWARARVYGAATSAWSCMADCSHQAFAACTGNNGAGQEAQPT